MIINKSDSTIIATFSRTNRPTHESKGQKLSPLLLVKQRSLASHHRPVNIRRRVKRPLLPRTNVLSAARLRNLRGLRLLHLHTGHVSQSLIEELQHALQILPLLNQRLVLLGMIALANHHRHEAGNEVSVVDIGDQRVVDVLHGAIEQVQRDALRWHALDCTYLG